MTNNRYGGGLILAITTPKSIKGQDSETYSERNWDVKYRVNFEMKNYYFLCSTTCEVVFGLLKSGAAK
jgi:hypothetical protein